MDIVKVNGWTLTQEGEGEPLIQDLELATRLGYARPGNIRGLIRRMEEAGQLTGVYFTAKQTSTKGGRPSEEYHLTEAQSLKVIARSKTDAADKILDEVIGVYIQWRRGQLASPAPAPSGLEQQVKQLADLVGMLVSMEHARCQREARAESTPVDFPATSPRLPAASKAKANQGELIPLHKAWYLVADLCREWDIEYSDLWREFGRAGGRRKDQARQSNRGWQVREEIARKILVQLEYQRGVR